MDIQIQAKKYSNNQKPDTFDCQMRKDVFYRDRLEESFIAGATSESAKEYWYKQFEAEK